MIDNYGDRGLFPFFCIRRVVTHYLLPVAYCLLPKNSYFCRQFTTVC